MQVQFISMNDIKLVLDLENQHPFQVFQNDCHTSTVVKYKRWYITYVYSQRQHMNMNNKKIKIYDFYGLSLNNTSLKIVTILCVFIDMDSIHVFIPFGSITL